MRPPRPTSAQPWLGLGASMETIPPVQHLENRLYDKFAIPDGRGPRKFALNCWHWREVQKKTDGLSRAREPIPPRASGRQVTENLFSANCL